MDTNDRINKAIESKDRQILLQVLQDELETFKISQEKLYRIYLREHNDPTIALEYATQWHKFCHNPITIYRRRKLGADKIDLNEILPKNGQKIPPNSSVDWDWEKYLDSIIKYVSYILQDKFKGESFHLLLIYSVLKVIEKAVDISSSMNITVTKVINKCNKFYKDFQLYGEIERPKATLYEGQLYNEKLGSSRKTKIHRFKILKEWVLDFISTYKSSHHYYPTRQELKEHLMEQCRNCDDSTLHIYDNKMNDKTLSYLIEHCGVGEMLRHGNLRMKNVDVPVSKMISEQLEQKEDKMTLLELYNILKSHYENRKG